MKRLFFLFAFILFCNVGCRKDYPVTSNETPVFYFNGSVNGAPMAIQAGVNNYYMYSFFKQDSNNVYNFFGELKPNNCVNCNNKIKFQINDDTVSPLNGTTQINTSLKTNYYAIQVPDSGQSGTPSEYIVNFTSYPSGAVASYSWNFGDGTSGLTANPVHTYSHPGDYNACLTINYSNGCIGSICNEVKAGVPDAACAVTLIDSSFSGNIISLSSFQTGTAPYIYIVDLGDGNTINSTSNTGFYNQHTYLNPGIYKVCIQVTDAGNCTSEVCKNVSTQGFTGGCLTNFDFYVQGANPNSLSLSNVIIKWTDHAGNEFSSNAISQPNDSYFKIISVENYSNNESNQLTKKLHIKFKCNLLNGNSSIIPINGNAVIAVSYK